MNMGRLFKSAKAEAEPVASEAPVLVPETKISARNVDVFYGDVRAVKSVDIDIPDQAVTAFKVIQAKHPKLTSVHLVVAGIYRAQAAAQAGDAAAQRALLELAAAAYDAVLQDNAHHDRARTEQAAVTALLNDLQ